MLRIRIDLNRIKREPLMSEARWTFTAVLALGIGKLFFADGSMAREILLDGFIGLITIFIMLVVYILISNSRLKM